MIYVCEYQSPLGVLTLTSDGEALTGLDFGPASGVTGETCPALDAAKRWLDVYFAGSAPDFTPPLHLSGTPFRTAVWELLLTVPYGETTTYGELAARLAQGLRVPKMSAQAVGGAVGKNPVALIVPCHRVIGAGKRLVGYAAGVDKKQALLALEGTVLDRL